MGILWGFFGSHKTPLPLPLPLCDGAPPMSITVNGENSQTEILQPYFAPNVTREGYHARYDARPGKVRRAA